MTTHLDLQSLITMVYLLAHLTTGSEVSGQTVSQNGLARATLKNPAFVSTKTKERAMNVLKKNLWKKGGVHEPLHEKQKQMTRLGLSEGNVVTSKDVET